MERWIKLYEKIKEWQHYQEPTVMLVFIDILLSANSKEGWKKGVKVEKGELITSVDAIHNSTGLDAKTIRKALKKLVESKEIVWEATTTGSKITIIQFDKYQKKGDEKPKSHETTEVPEEVPATQETPREDSDTPPPTQPPKVGYEIYGSFKNVQLKPSEYRTLEMNYSKAALDEAIENLSCKLADGTAQSTNNYATLTRWLSYVRKYGTEARQESGYKGDRSIGSEFTYKS